MSEDAVSSVDINLPNMQTKTMKMNTMMDTFDQFNPPKVRDAKMDEPSTSTPTQKHKMGMKHHTPETNSHTVKHHQPNQHSISVNNSQATYTLDSQAWLRQTYPTFRLSFLCLPCLWSHEELIQRLQHGQHHSWLILLLCFSRHLHRPATHTLTRHCIEIKKVPFTLKVSRSGQRHVTSLTPW